MAIKTKINQLVIVPLMVRVFALVHMWQVSISKLAAKLKITAVPHLQVALRAKQDAITEKIRTTIFSWFPVVGLPAPVSAFDSIGSADTFTASGTQSPLTLPSLLYSVGRKGHRSTSHVEVSNPRVRNGWVRNEDMWVLIRDGKSYNIAVMPFRGVYRIFKGSKIIGFSRTLEAAKRRAEKIKITGRVFR